MVLTRAIDLLTRRSQRREEGLTELEGLITMSYGRDLRESIFGKKAGGGGEKGSDKGKVKGGNRRKDRSPLWTDRMRKRERG